MTGITLGFSMEALSVPLVNILPSRKVPEGLASSRKFRQIRSSIEDVGLIEPLSVTAAIKKSSQHMLLDGHIRLIVLSDMGYADAPCLVAKDDEGYTYNSRINRLSTIQEHFMIRRAIERGVAPERLAKALGVDVTHIIKKMTLLDGICPEGPAVFCRDFPRAAKNENHTAGGMCRINGVREYCDDGLCRSHARGNAGRIAGRRQKAAENDGRVAGADSENGAGNGKPSRAVQNGRADVRAGCVKSRARQGLPDKTAGERRRRSISSTTAAGSRGRVRIDHQDDCLGPIG